MSHTKKHEEIEKELQDAQKLIKIGGIYAHYKNPENLYKVIDLAIQEATDKICVIYQTQYGKKLLFVRDFDSWMDKPSVNNKTVKRFQLIK